MCHIIRAQIELTMEEDDLLYGDLKEAGVNAEILALREALEKERKISDGLREEIAQHKAQIISLVNDRTQLETNAVTIFNTAMREIKRKDAELARLRGCKS